MIYELTETWRGLMPNPATFPGGSPMVETEIFPGKIDGDYARRAFGVQFEWLIEKGFLVKVVSDGDKR